MYQCKNIQSYKSKKNVFNFITINTALLSLLLLMFFTFAYPHLVAYGTNPQQIGNVEQQERSCIAGYVWLDGNRNGMRDPIEKGVDKVLVKIYDFAGRQSGTDITDSSGYFIFSDLPYGQYHVEFIQPAGFEFPEDTSNEEGWTLVNTMDCEENSEYETPLVTTASSGPTIIALETFVAEPNYIDIPTIEIEWTTSSEIDTAGFYLYRTINNGYREEAVRVTPQIVSALGDPQQGHNLYAFTDTNYFPEVGSFIYTYWLVEEETTGNLNEYGPIHVKQTVSASSVEGGDEGGDEGSNEGSDEAATEEEVAEKESTEGVAAAGDDEAAEATQNMIYLPIIQN